MVLPLQLPDINHGYFNENQNVNMNKSKNCHFKPSIIFIYFEDNCTVSNYPFLLEILYAVSFVKLSTRVVGMT